LTISHVTEALVLGDEPLLGIISMEAMDLVVHPREQKLMVNPQPPKLLCGIGKIIDPMTTYPQCRQNKCRSIGRAKDLKSLCCFKNLNVSNYLSE
jgi:hypothetical protein